MYIHVPPVFHLKQSALHTHTSFLCLNCDSELLEVCPNLTMELFEKKNDWMHLFPNDVIELVVLCA